MTGWRCERFAELDAELRMMPTRRGRPRKYPPRERPGRPRKLGDAAILEIRSRRASGEKLKDIARDFPVSLWQISRIASNEQGRIRGDSPKGEHSVDL